VHSKTLSRKQEQTKQKRAQAIKQQFSEQRRIKSACGKIYKNLLCTIIFNDCELNAYACLFLTPSCKNSIFANRFLFTHNIFFLCAAILSFCFEFRAQQKFIIKLMTIARALLSFVCDHVRNWRQISTQRRFVNKQFG
jgi:hypothetical protein